jgi:hypothetical protein
MKVLLTLLLLFHSQISFAQQWIEVSQTDRATHYIDALSIQKLKGKYMSNRVTFMVMVDLKSPTHKGIRSIRLFVNANCKNKEHFISGVNLYAGQMGQNYVDGTHEGVMPYKMNERTFQMVCAD